MEAPAELLNEKHACCSLTSRVCVAPNSGSFCRGTDLSHTPSQAVVALCCLVISAPTLVGNQDKKRRVEMWSKIPGSARALFLVHRLGVGLLGLRRHTRLTFVRIFGAAKAVRGDGGGEA